MRKRTLKKDVKRLKGKARALIFYAVIVSIILFAVVLSILERFSPLETIYLYLISFAVTFLVVYPIASLKMADIIKSVSDPLERFMESVDEFIEGKLESVNIDDESYWRELSEKLAVLGESLRENVIAIKDSLYKLQEIAGNSDPETIKKEISSILENIEERFKIDQRI
ncbi:MAG: hypothetical protein J7L62_06835 [Candidatus Aminicenantes bacterium]|nr:hypothetical protein [Candidatus Aminicenantes bacterium]